MTHFYILFKYFVLTYVRYLANHKKKAHLPDISETTKKNKLILSNIPLG